MDTIFPWRRTANKAAGRREEVVGGHVNKLQKKSTTSPWKWKGLSELYAGLESRGWATIQSIHGGRRRRCYPNQQEKRQSTTGAL